MSFSQINPHLQQHSSHPEHFAPGTSPSNPPLFLPVPPTMTDPFYPLADYEPDLAAPTSPTFSSPFSLPSSSSASSCTTSSVYSTVSSTPSYSTRSSIHRRNANSTSSIEFCAPGSLANPLPPPPVLPVDLPLPKTVNKTPLPDVMEEEPYDVRDRLARTLGERNSWVDDFGESHCRLSTASTDSWPCPFKKCLRDDPCCHMNDDSMEPLEIDYERVLGDLDCSSSFKSQGPPSSALSHLTSRLGARIPGMKRWRSKQARRPTLTSNPSSDLPYDSAFMPPTSSRSSSVSHTRRFQMDPLHTSVSPAISTCDSTESIPITTSTTINSIDVDNESSRKGIVRDRSNALTPLLPPLLNDAIARPPPSSQPVSPTSQSPLASPFSTMSMDDQLQTAMKHASIAPSHRSGNTLSSKPSISSFRPQMSENQPLFPKITDESDIWAQKLGHADYTISPAPYQPEEPTHEALTKLRDDWQVARTEYTKHLARTGENYGQTSAVYILTVEKWKTIESEWRKHHQSMIARVHEAQPISTPASAIPISTVQTSFPSVLATSMPSRFPQLSLSRSNSRGRTHSRTRTESGGVSLRNQPISPTSHPVNLLDTQWKDIEDAIPRDIPRLLDSSKFPSRGDEDIVGPMVRDAVMLRSPSEERRIEQFNQQNHGKFWRSLLTKMKK